MKEMTLEKYIKFFRLVKNVDKKLLNHGTSKNKGKIKAFVYS